MDRRGEENMMDIPNRFALLMAFVLIVWAIDSAISFKWPGEQTKEVSNAAK